MTIEVEGGQMRLDISQIYYIESQRHNILFHTEKGDFLTAGPMKKVEALLKDKGFSKCHNAYLIPPDACDRYCTKQCPVI
mgnify:CR=1 FL=1